jgi:hypothetical protein
MHRRQDRIPDFDQVVAAGVAQDAKGGIGSEGGKDVADELVAIDYSA